jgi:hypothetical protein
MWKTLGSFWAQMGPFAYILPPETAHIHSGATGLPFFRRPYLNLGGMVVKEMMSFVIAN